MKRCVAFTSTRSTLIFVSQVGCGDPRADNAGGLLLHPSIGEMVDETVVIQGHRIRFATVDLTASATEIRFQLLNCVSQRPVS